MNSPLVLASHWRRLLATIIDMALVPVLTLLLVMITGVIEDAEDYANNWYILWILLLAILSYLILNGYTLWQRGQTLGKMALGIAMVRADSTTTTPAPWWKLVFIRAWFFPLLFLVFVGVVIPWIVVIPLLDHLSIFGKRRRCLHDLAAGTQVIRRERHA